MTFSPSFPTILILLSFFHFPFSLAIHEAMHPQLPLTFLSTAALVNSTPLGGATAPADASLKSIVFAGSGCDPSQASAKWKIDDQGALQMLTPDLKVTTGEGAARTDARKFCQANADVQVPAGWQFAVKNVGASGYANLTEGVTGVMIGTVYFSGNGGDKSWTKQLSGEMHGAFTSTYEPVNETVWSDCGKEALLNVKVETRFENRDNSKTGTILVDVTNVQVEWRKC